MVHMVLRDICKNAGHFGVIVDGTQDMQSVEHEAICMRYVDNAYNVHEDFIGMYSVWDDWCQPQQHVTRHTAHTQPLHDALESTNLWWSQQHVRQIPGLLGPDQDNSTTGALHALRCTQPAPDLCECHRECTVPTRCSERGAGTGRVLQMYLVYLASLPLIECLKHFSTALQGVETTVAGTFVYYGATLTWSSMRSLRQQLIRLNS